MSDKPYYLAYESRYQKVHEAGGNWGRSPEDEELTEYLTEWVSQNNLKGKRIIEFACGEGASGAILSKLGCIYHGVDIAPSAVEKAKNLLADYPNASVSVLDMVNEKIDGTYDAALDLGGFHMLVTDPDRTKYLKNAFSCLTNHAPMLFHELYQEDAHDEFIGSFDDWLSITNNDYTITRINKVFNKEGKEVEVNLPYVPGRAKTKEGYIKEMSEAGFKVDSIIEMPPPPESACIYVHKP